MFLYQYQEACHYDKPLLFLIILKSSLLKLRKKWYYLSYIQITPTYIQITPTYIKKHPKVTVTIDTFQWGIVFFRIEQVKENFIIRTRKSFFLDNVLGIKNLWGLLH